MATSEEDIRLVKEELSKYTFQYLQEFAEHFPVRDMKISFYVFNLGTDVGSIGIENVHVMSRKKQASTCLRKNSEDFISEDIGANPAHYVDILCNSIPDFWTRWNRFLKMKVFL